MAVTLILMLAGCTTSTAEPTGIVTGLAFACSGLPPFVTGRPGGKGPPLLRVAARCLGDGGFGCEGPVLSLSWVVPPDGLVGVQDCGRTGRSHRHCQLHELLQVAGWHPCTRTRAV